MQLYSYRLTQAPGDLSDYPDFTPYFTPAEMLALGVFEGKYCNDCYNELPREWYAPERMSVTADPALNCFGIKSRLSRGEWLRKGWLPCCPDDPDVRGWFQWYCRFWLGRRLPGIDEHQIKRWRAYKRHFAQVLYNCEANDVNCRPKQRQSLLQWSYNCFV